MPISSTSPMILESIRCSMSRTLTLYHTPVAYQIVIPDEPTLTFKSPQSFPVDVPLPPSLMRPPTEEIEGILTDETVSITDGTYHRYLVCWRGRPDSDCTWLPVEEIMQLNPELLHDFHRRHSPEAKFSKPRRVDAISSRTWWTYVCIRRNSLQLLVIFFIDKLSFLYLVVAFPHQLGSENSFCMELIKSQLDYWVV